MPRGDGTGPNGLGPMTGRAAGYCAGWGTPGYMNWGVGYGRSLHLGRGLGWRRGFGYGPAYGSYPAYPFGSSAAPEGTEDSELRDLEQQAQYLERELKAIRKRIEALGTAAEQNKETT